MLVSLLQATIARMDLGFRANGEDIQELSLTTSTLKPDLRSIKKRVSTKTQDLDFLAGSSVWLAIQDLTHLGIGLMKLQQQQIAVGDSSVLDTLIADCSPIGALLSAYKQKIGDLKGKLQHVLTVQGNMGFRDNSHPQFLLTN